MQLPVTDIHKIFLDASLLEARAAAFGAGRPVLLFALGSSPFVGVRPLAFEPYFYAVTCSEAACYAGLVAGTNSAAPQWQCAFFVQDNEPELVRALQESLETRDVPIVLVRFKDGFDGNLEILLLVVLNGNAVGNMNFKEYMAFKEDSSAKMQPVDGIEIDSTLLPVRVPGVYAPDRLRDASVACVTSSYTRHQHTHVTSSCASCHVIIHVSHPRSHRCGRGTDARCDSGQGRMLPDVYKRPSMRHVGKLDYFTRPRYVTSSYMLCHIIVRTMSHHHASLCEYSIAIIPASAYNTLF